MKDRLNEGYGGNPMSKERRLTIHQSGRNPKEEAISREEVPGLTRTSRKV